MGNEIFKYNEDNLVVVWKPALCIHSKLCWRNLPSVFNPSRRPWIKLQGTDVELVISQVKKCPSGALSYEILDMETAPNTTRENGAATTQLIKVESLKNGPLLVTGSMQITDSNGTETSREGPVAFCRCGASANKPYCDGSHRRNGFTG